MKKLLLVRCAIYFVMFIVSCVVEVHASSTLLILSVFGTTGVLPVEYLTIVSFVAMVVSAVLMYFEVPSLFAFD